MRFQVRSSNSHDDELRELKVGLLGARGDSCIRTKVIIPCALETLRSFNPSPLRPLKNLKLKD